MTYDVFERRTLELLFRTSTRLSVAYAAHRTRCSSAEASSFLDEMARRGLVELESDERGNLYCAMRGGIWVASAEGKSLGLIPIPEFATNAAFGGPDGKTLYVTCDKKVYSLRMTVGGPKRVER